MKPTRFAPTHWKFSRGAPGFCVGNVTARKMQNRDTVRSGAALGFDTLRLESPKSRRSTYQNSVGRSPRALEAIENKWWARTDLNCGPPACEEFGLLPSFLYAPMAFNNLGRLLSLSRHPLR